MGFWIFMLFVDLLVPLTMMGVGKRFITKPPQKINSIYGYRTTMSMKNKDTWEFAHQYCGKVWFRCGWICIPFSVIPLIFVLDNGIDTIGIVGVIVCTVQLVPLIGSIFLTESALKKTFDENGIRR